MRKFNSYKSRIITQAEKAQLLQEGVILVSFDDVEKYKSLQTPKFIINEYTLENGVSGFRLFETDNH